MLELRITVITPECPIWMTGFAARTEPADGVYQDIEASVVVLESAGRRIGILAVDLVGVDEWLLEPIRAAAANVGIEPSCMLVNCSHTHCAPACRVARGSNRHFDFGWLEGLKQTVAELLSRAVADLQEAKLDYTVGTCALGINRRRLADNGTSGMLPDPDKPIDLDVPVLRILTPGGDVRAILFSYASHPTTMGGQQVGPDFPGPARELLREAVPGCVPIFLQGCGGDVKPRNVDPVKRTFASGPIEAVYEIGHELGRAVEAALCGTPEPLGEGVDGAHEMAHLPTSGTPSEQTLQGLEAEGSWQKAYAEAARKTIAESGGLAETLPVEVQVLRIGELYIVGMGGEISVEIGLEIKERLPEKTVWTLGVLQPVALLCCLV